MRSTWNVRKLITGAVLLFASPALHAAKKGATPSSYFVYIGTYTSSASKGIYVFRFDPSNGTATRHF